MHDSYHFLKGLPLCNIKINDVVVVAVVVVAAAVVVQSCAPVWPSGKALGW